MGERTINMCESRAEHVSKCGFQSRGAAKGPVILSFTVINLGWWYTAAITERIHRRSQGKDG